MTFSILLLLSVAFTSVTMKTGPDKDNPKTWEENKDKSKDFNEISVENSNQIFIERDPSSSMETKQNLKQPPMKITDSITFIGNNNLNEEKIKTVTSNTENNEDLEARLERNENNNSKLFRTNTPSTFILSFILLLFCSSTVVFGFGTGVFIPLTFSLFSHLSFPEFLPICSYITFALCLVCHLFGTQNHIQEGSLEQMFINYELIQIFFPFLLLGIKIGLIANFFIQTRYLTVVLVIATIYTIVMMFKRYQILNFQESFLESELKISDLSNQENSSQIESFTIGFLNTNYTDFSEPQVLTKKSSHNNIYNNTYNTHAALGVRSALNTGNLTTSHLALNAFNSERHDFSFGPESQQNKKKSRRQEILQEIEKNSFIQFNIITQNESSPVRADFIKNTLLLGAVGVIASYIEYKIWYFDYIFVKLLLLILAFLLEFKVLINLSQEYINNYSQSYSFKQELIQKYSCAASQYIISNWLMIGLLISLFGFVQGSTGIGAGVFFLLLFSTIGLNPYVSATSSNYLTMFSSLICFMVSVLTREDIQYLHLQYILGLTVFCLLLMYVFEKIQRLSFFRLKKQAIWTLSYSLGVLGLVFIKVVLVLFMFFAS